MRRKIAAGNWKMHGKLSDLAELAQIETANPEPKSEIVICPPALLIAAAAMQSQDGHVKVGGQDCHANDFGAHTGDISAHMLADAGARYVILGHSERREAYREPCASVRAKAMAAISAGLVPIICLGETLAEREAGEAQAVVIRQLQDSIPEIHSAEIVVAYEPIWAIGTGKIPTLGDTAEIHDAMRNALQARFGSEHGDTMSLLYGGSVKPSNAAEIFATSNVDGALVGGASLKAADFNQIIAALDAA